MSLVVTCLAGGLGNQMFEYAAGRRLAHARGVPLKLDLGAFGPDGDVLEKGLEAYRRHVRLQQFNIAADQATPAEIATVKDPFENTKLTSRIGRRLRRVVPNLAFPKTHWKERQYRFDAAVLDLPVPVYLAGYYQSEKYFADVPDLIRAELTPKDPAVAAYAKDYVGRIRAREGRPVVSVHVRRGELAHAEDVLKNTKGTFGPPTRMQYVGQAMAHFAGDGPEFLVFSDTAKDIDWCREHVRGDRLHFAAGHDDVQDMTLMSACDHHVVASTFSWWGAWLNPGTTKRVVAPRQWGHAGGPMVPDDLIPPGWHVIG